jgi:hypothetical protein
MLLRAGVPFGGAALAFVGSRALGLGDLAALCLAMAVAYVLGARPWLTGGGDETWEIEVRRAWIAGDALVLDGGNGLVILRWPSATSALVDGDALRHRRLVVVRGPGEVREVRARGEGLGLAAWAGPAVPPGEGCWRWEGVRPGT